MSRKTLLRMALKVQMMLRASAIQFKYNLYKVFYKIGGQWYEYSFDDVVEIATIGSTN